MKRITTLIGLMGFCLTIYAADDLTKAARCNWGYKKTALIIDKDSRDELYPGEVTSWELCKLAFNNDLSHDGSSWVVEALSFLEIPPNQIKPLQMITKKGHCEIGSILFQKKFLSVHDHVTIKLTAKGVCNSMPASLLEDKKH